MTPSLLPDLKLVFFITHGVSPDDFRNPAHTLETIMAGTRWVSLCGKDWVSFAPEP